MCGVKPATSHSHRRHSSSSGHLCPMDRVLRRRAFFFLHFTNATRRRACVWPWFIEHPTSSSILSNRTSSTYIQPCVPTAETNTTSIHPISDREPDLRKSSRLLAANAKSTRCRPFNTTPPPHQNHHPPIPPTTPLPACHSAEVRAPAASRTTETPTGRKPLRPGNEEPPAGAVAVGRMTPLEMPFSPEPSCESNSKTL